MAPAFGVGARFQLPPIRLDAKIVETLYRARRRVRIDGAILRRDDLDQQLMARRPACIEQPKRLPLLPLAQFGRVVGVIEEETFDDVVERL